MAISNELKERLVGDEQFTNSLREARTTQELLEKLQAEGYSVTEEEIRNVCDSDKSGEIPDGDLDCVNGGVDYSRVLEESMDLVVKHYEGSYETATVASAKKSSKPDARTLELRPNDKPKVEKLPKTANIEPQILLL